MSPADLDAALSSSLEELGRFVGADRSYIIRYEQDTATSWMTHEWCAPGVPPSFDMEQDNDVWDAPRQQERLARLEVNEITDVGVLPDDWAADREYLQRQGISAILEVPFSLDGDLAGVIGFDCVSSAVAWRSEDVTALRAVASLLAQVLARSLDRVRAVEQPDRAPGNVRGSTGAADARGRGRPSPAGQHGHGRAARDPPRDARGLTASARSCTTRTWNRCFRSGGRCCPPGDLTRARAPRCACSPRAASGGTASIARATRSPDGHLTYTTIHLTDIDDARRAAAALHTSERRFGTLVENLPDSIMRFDRRGQVVFANATAHRLRDELERLGTPMAGRWPKIPNEVRTGFQRAMRAALDRQETHTLEYGLGPSDDEIWSESTFVPEIDVDGNVESVLLVARDITERRRQEAELAHRATHDTLTGLPNRALMLAMLGQASDGLSSRPGTLALLFLDLDRFKLVNDSLGHGMGDQLLCRVAERSASVLRPGDLLARLGGDEFTVLLSDVDGHRGPQVARRLQDALRVPIDDRRHDPSR